jgi:hypothetical protein
MITTSIPGLSNANREFYPMTNRVYALLPAGMQVQCVLPNTVMVNGTKKPIQFPPRRNGGSTNILYISHTTHTILFSLKPPRSEDRRKKELYLPAGITHYDNCCQTLVPSNVGQDYYVRKSAIGTNLPRPPKGEYCGWNLVHPGLSVEMDIRSWFSYNPWSENMFQLTMGPKVEVPFIELPVCTVRTPVSDDTLYKSLRCASNINGTIFIHPAVVYKTTNGIPKDTIFTSNQHEKHDYTYENKYNPVKMVGVIINHMEGSVSNINTPADEHGLFFPPTFNRRGGMRCRNNYAFFELTGEDEASQLTNFPLIIMPVVTRQTGRSKIDATVNTTGTRKVMVSAVSTPVTTKPHMETFYVSHYTPDQYIRDDPMPGT